MKVIEKIKSWFVPSDTTYDSNLDEYITRNCPQSVCDVERLSREYDYLQRQQFLPLNPLYHYRGFR